MRGLRRIGGLLICGALLGTSCTVEGMEQALANQLNAQLAQQMGVTVEWLAQNNMLMTPQGLENMGRDLERDINNFGREMGDCHENIAKYETAIRQLEGGAQVAVIDGRQYLQADLPNLRGRLARERDNDWALGQAQGLVGGGIGVVRGFLDELKERPRREHIAKLQRETEVEKAEVAQAGRRRIVLDVLNFFKSPKHLAYLVGASAGLVLSYYVIKHGTSIVAEQIRRRLGRPDVVEASSRLTFLEWWMGKKKLEQIPLSDFIAAPALRERLVNFADDTRNARSNGDCLSNLLLYGPPGTGKTMFSKALAGYANIDFGYIKGPTLEAYPIDERIVEFNKILKWAEKSPKGTMLIFDEAEALFPDRHTASEASRKFVSYFLAHVDKGFNKNVMFVFISNYPKRLDLALLSRAGLAVRIPRPEVPELIELIKLYASKVQESMVRLDEGLEDYFPEFAMLAKQGNLTGRDIELLFKVYIVQEVRRSEDSVITYDIVNTVLKDYVKRLQERDEFILA